METTDMLLSKFRCEDARPEPSELFGRWDGHGFDMIRRGEAGQNSGSVLLCDEMTQGMKRKTFA